MRSKATDSVMWKCISDLQRVHGRGPEVVRVCHLLETLMESVDMILHCPACGLQHIDAPELQGRTWIRVDELLACEEVRPHKSHNCHSCGHVWRPADVPTNGVAALKTEGKDDGPVVQPAGGVTRSSEVEA